MKQIGVGTNTFYLENQEPEVQELTLETTLTNMEILIGATSPSLDEAGIKNLIDELGITDDAITNGWENNVYERVVSDEAIYEFRAWQGVQQTAELRESK